ncbi:uncharacterized protein LOC127834932 isoform X1 [Dreissena polymorpha]|uniref:uncharacterized protein LOC127834932 isoform X1 n=1 Tax=Dreissena polymorpha TaxID=45954 RepID=UPI0022654D09|nr:uncharacterized protein LOC127834932 isoform X1 [Dreissena polymorpha]
MAVGGKRYFLNVGSYSSAGFLLIVLVMVVILVWTMPDIKPVDGNTYICLQDNRYLRCSETVTTLSQILEKEVENVYAKPAKQDAEDTKSYFNTHVKIELKNDYLASIPDMKPAAKLVGQISNLKQEPQRQEMESVVSWLNGRELDYTTGFLRYGVRYHNGRLIVPLTGTYNIYSFLSLTESNDYSPVQPSVKSTNQTLVKHAMYKYNVKIRKDVELASSLQTHRASNGRNFNAFSSQISTLVQLEAGDEISVKISDISLTSYPSDNFFGLHMI